MKPVLPLLMAAALGGCASLPFFGGNESPTRFEAVRTSEHRGGDDLLTAGLGLEGLRGNAPSFANPASPTPAELRRRAIWTNWRGIADLSPGGGYGQLYGSVAAVPGREFHALMRVPGARHPHRVAVQVPDAFDLAKRCIVVVASSGSRGIYGGIAVGGAWGLPKGCAVAYTDKAAGTDFYDLDAGRGVRIDGTIGAPGEPLAFVPDGAKGGGVAVKHAHSRDNPEADWGRHVRQAAEFALYALDQSVPEAAPFRFDNTRVIAVGMSNGGGAVLRAAEDEEPWLDAVVASEPNVFVEGAPAMYDYATEAALLMPCALPQVGIPPLPNAPDPCQNAVEAGLLRGATAAERQRAAYQTLRARGWTDAAIRGGAISVALDLWRAIAVTYASAYGRYGVGEHPCGHRFAVLDSAGAPRGATVAERAAWWADSSGIPPGAGVSIVRPAMTAAAELQCLRALWTGTGADARRVRDGALAIRARPPRDGLP
ncbi:MAG TPA: 3-hydroxybutyrate oligomer hydrolase family protein, partial [Lysobacter sp.]|nr:3-hydroxybutyrate oligomer hydrolase family protein [Lysobacter sp.]